MARPTLKLPRKLPGIESDEPARSAVEGARHEMLSSLTAG